MRPLTLPIIRRLAWAAALLAAFLALFWPTLTWMAERFEAHDSFYSHGWLVPLASAWLVWLRRERLAQVRSQPSYAGLWLLAPAAAIHVLASWWRLHFISGFAMNAAIWGLVWTVWGREVVWTLRFPLAFLLFMVPLPGVLLISFSFQLKLIAASLAAKALPLLGVPASQAGSTIHVPGLSVIVDDTCSGLRSLISLTALSTLWAALMPSSAARWQRLTIVAAAIPIALIANMVRIVVLVLLSVIYGRAAAEGFLHYGSGLVVFGLSLLALAWLTRVVQRWSPPGLLRAS